MKSTVQVGLDSWRKRSVNTSILAAMVTVGSIAMFVKLAAVAKDVVIGHAVRHQ